MKIEKTTAKKLFPESPEWFRKDLVEAFGKDCFEKKNFRDIKTFEDACEELGITNESCHPIFDEEESPDEIAYKKLKIIIKAINQGWEPDWSNSNEYKYWPYFNLSSGFGFSGSGYYCAFTYSGVGSRLCFETREKCEYAANQFLDLYKQFLI